MILVTGGTGLVGAHLLLHLVENEASVRAIYRNSASIEKTKILFSIYKKEYLFEKIEWVQADIIQTPSLKKAFENIDYVYHCAGLISFDPKDEAILRKTNIEGTANIINFCIDFAVKKICFVSSIATLGDLKENEKQTTEKTEWNPELYHSDYAISKYGAEMEIWRGQQEGVDAVVVNPGVILGPGFWEQGSGLLFKKIAEGFPFYTKGITGFVAVTDVVEITAKLMKSNIKNERFILVANSISFQELFNSIADALNVKRPFVCITPFLMGVLWRFDWVVSTFLRTKRKLDRVTAIDSGEKHFYSTDKIKEKLKIDFISIHDYLKDL